MRLAALVALAAPLFCGGQPDNSSARYDCDTITCSLHDEWVVADNSTFYEGRCAEAQATAMAGFGTRGSEMCRESMSKLYPVQWSQCRVEYCQMYEDLLHDIIAGQGPGHYGGEECEPLLSFNKSLCETTYRDAEAFCSCFCPTMLMLDDGDVCDKEIMGWLLFGRRGGLLEERHPLSEFCSERLCRFMEKVGHPSPPKSLQGSVEVPSICRKLDLPFRHGHCKALLTTVPYEAEPWAQPMEQNDTYMCSDKSTHVIDTSNVDTLDICLEHDDRWRCPADSPVMCSERECVAKTDFCCVESAESCSNGRERQCSPILCSTLPEWSGIMTPDDFAASNAPPAPAPPPQGSPQEESMTVKWTATLSLIALIVLGGCVFTVMGCIYVGQRHYTIVTKVLIGPQRVVGLMMQEPRKIGPTFAHKSTKPHFPLKPKRPQHEIDAENADNAAAERLREAIQVMEDNAMRIIASADASGPTFVERQVEKALDLVMDRGLHVRDDLAPLYVRGERFLLAKAAERKLDVAVEAAQYEIGIVSAASGPSKTDFAANQHYWIVAEQLKHALEEAQEDNASQAQRARAAATLKELVAKVPQLPQDRCVPDPRGGGLLLLPSGHRTVFDKKTGDMSVQAAHDADEAPETVDVPGPDRLIDVGIEDARPVCAQYVKEGRCKAGRRCPWRHCKPKKGDAIRESFVWGDD